MRWLVDILVLVVAVAMLAGLVMYNREDESREALIKRAASARARLELEVRYRSISRSTELNARGWPVTVDPDWFEKDVPRNPLISAECPWVEVASLDQAGLQDPPLRMVIDGSTAGFWYNPYLGILRARVPVMVSDQEALEIYNRLNATRLASIFQADGVLEDKVTTSLVQQQREQEKAAAANDLDPTKPRKEEAAAPTPSNQRKPKERFTQVPRKD